MWSTHGMSEVAASARVTFVVADYMAVGPLGKLTFVGAGISFVSVDPMSGQSAPLSVCATASFDPKFVGESPQIVLWLEEAEDGTVVELPGRADQLEGQPVRLEVGAAEPLALTFVDGYEIPADALRPKANLLMQFQNGLPLQPGKRYTWRVAIDGETRDDWTDSIYVASPIAPTLAG
jgi:hypothetical protein